jgi:NAD(P)-dependent dehydrogenase (short-subunit alcohol dehydrogenase family)
MDFADKTVLVVGAGGMGLACARRFAAAGAQVVLSDIDAARLADVRCELSCAVIAGDIAKPSECRRIVDEATAIHGRLDILLNAAGVWAEGPSEHMTEAQYDRVLDINLKGAYFLSAAAMPHLEAVAGQMIHIASDAGLMGNSGAAAYCASKGGLVLLVKALALELAPRGVRVNAICPCDVETPMLAAQAEIYGAGDPDGYREALKRFYPQGPRTRFASPEEIAAFIFAIAGIEAITGAALQIDFGTTAGK